jgi:hypothetical protein
VIDILKLKKMSRKVAKGAAKPRVQTFSIPDDIVWF